MVHLLYFYIGAPKKIFAQGPKVSLGGPDVGSCLMLGNSWGPSPTTKLRSLLSFN